MAKRTSEFAPLFPQRMMKGTGRFEPFWLPLDGRPVINPACQMSNYLKTAFLSENPVISDIPNDAAAPAAIIPEESFSDIFDQAIPLAQDTQEPPPQVMPPNIDAIVAEAVRVALEEQSRSTMMAAAEKMVAEAVEAERASSLASASRIGDGIAEAVGRMSSMAEKGVLMAAQSAVRSIFGSSEKTPEAWEFMASKMSEAMEGAIGASKFVCHPDDAHLVREAVTRLSERGWTPPPVETDPTLKPGTLRLDSPDGGLEDSFGRRASILLESMERHDET